MRSGLSSEAAPDASLAGLLDSAQRHGLSALELRAGDGHGLSGAAAAAVVEAALQAAASAGVSITSYRDTGVDSVSDLVSLAGRLGCPILVELESGDASAALDRALHLKSAGVRSAITLRGESSLPEAEVARANGLDVAWVADPSQEHVGTAAAKLLASHADHLVSVRLLGGGPESVMHEGRGVGELMGRLALAGFGGAVVLAPSSRKFHVIWTTWLGRRGGFGCGSKASDDSLVSLG